MPVKGYVSEFQRRLDEGRDATPTTTRCADCSWRHVGPAGEGREAAREHRRLEHPARPLVAVRPKAKPKPKPTYTVRKSREASSEHRPRGRLRKMTSERTAAAAAVYREGWTVAMIAEVAQPLWGFASENSAQGGILGALKTSGVEMRPRGQRAPLPEIGRREAEEILRAAG